MKFFKQLFHGILSLNDRLVFTYLYMHYEKILNTSYKFSILPKNLFKNKITTIQKRKRLLISWVWEYFDYVDSENKVICQICESSMNLLKIPDAQNNIPDTQTNLTDARALGKSNLASQFFLRRHIFF